MKALIFSLLFLISIQASAQFESSKKPLNIKAAEEAKKKNNLFAKKKKPFVLPGSGKEQPSLFGPKAKTINGPVDPKAGLTHAGKEYEGKFSFKQKDRPIDPKFRKNQNLGNFRSGADKVRFICRDHEYVDGDRIKVLVNGKIVQPNIYLTGRFKGFNIDLEEGFNKIDIVALNQGSSGPNTAEFRVIDNSGNLVTGNQWNLATGVKATLVITKEQVEGKK